MLIPRAATSYTASTYMNFVYDPKIAAQIDGSVNYMAPVNGAQQGPRSPTLRSARTR